ncbi:MAG: hypothetical protein QOE83_1763 [Actinomycetota bacterium]|nr:hypothetical protein [Actinomycetota bacterium]
MSRKPPLLTALLAVLLVASAAPPVSAAITRAPANASYRVHLTSDRQGHTWTGTESITFTNTTSGPMRTVWLHLWSNGVKGCRAHAITVSHLTGGTAGRPILRCTSLPIHLTKPLDAHRARTISMHLRIQLFHRDDRFGFDGGISFVGTALPTLAVHDDHGWNLNPFTDIGESFYSVVSNYRVTLDTPSWLQTPATGVLQSSANHGGRVTRTYGAHQVRDFEWAAARFHRLVGLAGATRVRVWYLPSLTTASVAKQARADAIRSMNTFARDFGPYPYPEVDVVLGAGRGFAGMEYPTIVFAEPQQTTIAHELGHQWFYGIIGDDQYREPWLDESFASWGSALPFGDPQDCASYAWPNPKVQLDSSMAYFRRVPEAYGVVYSGGSCMLSQLSHRFGPRTFFSVLRDYVAAHRLGIARTRDFRHVVTSAARAQLPGFDIAGFWHTWRLDGP